MLLRMLASTLALVSLLASAQVSAAVPITTTTSDGTVPGTTINYTISASGTAREIFSPGATDADTWSWSNGFPEFVGVNTQTLTVSFSEPVPINRLVLGVNSFSSSTFTLTLSGGTAATTDFDLADGIATFGGTATYDGASGTFNAPGTNRTLMIGSTSAATITSFTLSGNNGADGYTLFFGTTDSAPVTAVPGPVGLPLALLAMVMAGGGYSALRKGKRNQG